MDEFIMKTYYLATKQNIADGDKNTFLESIIDMCYNKVINYVYD